MEVKILNTNCSLFQRKTSNSTSYERAYVSYRVHSKAEIYVGRSPMGNPNLDTFTLPHPFQRREGICLYSRGNITIS